MGPQQSIAHYRVVSKLGEGGMGAVYRATDTKLHRDVAIKVLPDAFASDPGRLARFQREAQFLAQLNHANIAAIYGVEERAIIMELAEGESPQGPLSADDAMALLDQLIDALEYAHDKGIVHRDLKPANLKLSPDGRLKVLDFGLAKALSPESPAAQATNPAASPTISMGATKAGVIMGTAAYMSPEQARGQPVDKRADIWSFGVVVYELLTGKSLFDGGTVSDTLAAVLRQDLDLSAVPPRFRRLLAKCLTRDPRQRLRDISGARLLLEEPAAESAAPQPPPSRLHWFWPAAAGVLLFSTAFLSILHFREPPPAAVVRSSIPSPDNARLVPTSMAVSPDGRRIAFTARTSDGKTQLWIRALDSLKAQPLAGTDNATFPFWSPDGKSLGFFSDSKLNRMDLTSGLILALADASAAGNARGAAWSPTGVILFAPGGGGPLKKVSASGGQVTDASQLSSAERSHRWPYFLPDGVHYLFLAGESNSTARRRVRFGALNSMESKPLMESDSEAVYSSGHILFMLNSTLMAQPFDPARLALSGDPKPVAKDVSTAPVPGKGGFSASLNGLLLYGADAVDRELRWFDREGRSLGTLGEKGYFETLSFSADHKSLAVTGGNDNREISVWLVDLAKGTRQRLTAGPSDQDVVLSADGSTVIYTSHRNGRDAIYRKAVNGSGAEELLLADEKPPRASSISPDNRNLLVRSPAGEFGFRILPDPLGHTGAPASIFLASPYNLGYGEFSPDGKWVAYESNETGRPEIYVVSFPGGGNKLRISPAGGLGHRWRGDGREILYLRPDFMLMAVEVAVRNGKMETGAVRELFRFQPHVQAGRDWGISADGQRILAIVPPDAAAPSLTLVQNWVSGLSN